MSGDINFEPKLQSRLLRRGLKLSHLRLFAALAETPQVTAAAATLGISQPAASRLAAEAEKITRTSLYMRSTSGIELTAAGIALARRARRILLEFEQTDREIEEIVDGRQGNTFIGTVTGPALEHILPAIRQARLSLPRVTVNIQVATSDVLGKAMIDGHLDFALARLPAREDPTLFHAQTVGPEPISLIVRSGHPILRQPAAPLETLMEFDWVLPFEGALLRTTIEKRLTALGLPLPRKIVATSSFLLTVAAVQQTNAVAPVSTAVARFFSSLDGSGSGITRLPSDFLGNVEPYALLSIAGRDMTPAAAALYEIVRNKATADRPDE